MKLFTKFANDVHKIGKIYHKNFVFEKFAKGVHKISNRCINICNSWPQIFKGCPQNWQNVSQNCL